MHFAPARPVGELEGRVLNVTDKLRAFLKSHPKARVALIALAAVAVLLFVLHPRGTRTYLVLGMDNYGSLEETGRSDVMMLVQIDFTRSRIYAATFARDLMVKREDGRDVKLNTIVRNQDEEALVDAIERNFGVRADGWFRVNFTSVIELVDALGGAQVELTAEEVRYLNRGVGIYPSNPLEEGVCRLNGAQALAYARCRKLDNDFGRGARQSKLLEALVKQTRRLSVAKIAGVYNSLNHAWRSSLSGGQQAMLLARALWLRGAKVVRIGVPFEGTYRYGADAGVVAKLDVNREMLLEALGRENAAAEKRE